MPDKFTLTPEQEKELQEMRDGNAEKLRLLNSFYKDIVRIAGDGPTRQGDARLCGMLAAYAACELTTFRIESNFRHYGRR